MKEALKQVSSLIDRFQQNIEAYRSPAYNETQLRIEFIDPFFEALGWDVTNLRQGEQEIIRDVVGFQYPLKIVVSIEKDAATVITNYPLKKGRKK